MSDFTSGELRAINESLNGWEMAINTIKSYMDNVPEDVIDRIDSVAEGYRKSFREYLIKTRSEGVEQTIDSALGEFDVIYSKENPIVYDFRALFEGCSKEDLDKVEAAISDVMERFAE
jgi:hypothetical protein